MQTGKDYVFHLDAPRERPRAGSTEVMGWIAAMHPIADVKLLGTADQDLSLRERPDVVLAFPGHQFVVGFSGLAEKRDVRAGCLNIAFTVGGVANTVTEPLPEPPAPSPWYERMAAQLTTAVMRFRLRMAKSPRARWNAALRLLLSGIRRDRRHSFRRMEGDSVLALFAEHFPDAVVVQIGANDGVAGDPLARYFASTRWTGVLVEPVPDLYAALARRYQQRIGLALEQAAISDRDGVITLYRLLEEPGVTPEWFQQLATIDRSVLLKHRTLIPDIEKHIVEESVAMMSLPTLLARHALPRIDLLVIDTEGHDYCILRQMTFHRYHPVVLMFEHQHLPPAEKAEANLLLRKHRYHWAETPEGDTLAWRFL